MSHQKLILSIVELGGYPNFSTEYERLGFDVVIASSMRKALSAIKRQPPDVVVVEFNFQSDFRDRTSNLESLLATLQARCPDTRVVVFYDLEYAPQFERVRSRFDIFAAHPFPIDQEQLMAGLQQLTMVE